MKSFISKEPLLTLLFGLLGCSGCTSWWVNRKDRFGKNGLEGGFLAR
jgi:hypothetical protein